uniref:Ataxin 7-like 1 n=1 Tax=Hucho hucho TaxID=62062 RepID=A0A4W5R6Q1_9TELE
DTSLLSFKISWQKTTSWYSGRQNSEIICVDLGLSFAVCLVCTGRVFDPNKHCGVQDPESQRSCTRSLTCKTHSLIHRRAVPGRQKEFDILLAEHKGRAKEKEKEKEGGQRRESQGGSRSTRANDTTPSTLPPHCHNGRTVSTLKLRLASAHVPRVPGSGGAAVLSSTPVPPASTQDPPVPVWQRAGGDRDGRLSSDEGDPGTPDDPDRDIDGDRPSCYYSPHHPRPLGVCTCTLSHLADALIQGDLQETLELSVLYLSTQHFNIKVAMCKNMYNLYEGFVSNHNISAASKISVNK